MTADHAHALGDQELLRSFEACTLTAEAFHHRDHVRVAWLYLRQGTLLQALDRFVTGLQRFAAHHGKPGLYHQTITWAFVLLIQERSERSPADSWDRFASENPDLLQWNPSALERYYRPETLQSELARRAFVLPDAGLR